MSTTITTLSIFVLVSIGSCYTSKIWDASLLRMNQLRAIHRVGPVKSTVYLETHAQEWADTMAEHDLWQHSTTWYGENIAGGWANTMEDFNSTDKNKYVIDAINMWYSEIKDYNFNFQGWSTKTGHFTQLVWRSTTEVGIGVSYREESKMVFVVMNYNPPGNYPSRFSDNVFPPIQVRETKGAPPSPPPTSKPKPKPPNRRLLSPPPKA